MIELQNRHKLAQKSDGVVFAASCRITTRDPLPLVKLLERVKQSKLLLWTGTGEPSILRGRVEWVTRFFEERGLGDRIDFDCAITDSWVVGYTNEICFQVVQEYKNLFARE